MRTRLGAAILLASAAPAMARVLLSQDEALKLAFGAASEIDSRTVFLTAAQKKAAGELAGTDLDRELVTVYSARRDGKPAGRAYFDTHQVRTLSETLMVAVAPDGSLLRVEVISFAEPPE